MTGKDAILHYYKTPRTCSSMDVAETTGMSHSSINQAANILVKQDVLVAVGKVWRMADISPPEEQADMTFSCSNEYSGVP